MGFLEELDEIADRFRDEAQGVVREGVRRLEEHLKEDPTPLFRLLRTVRPVLTRGNLAIVTQYDDVREVLTHDEVFSVQPYRDKMVRLAGDFILGMDDSAAYERDVSILRLAAPRSDVSDVEAYVAAQAEGLVAASGGVLDVADLAKRVPARAQAAWFGTPGPDEDTSIGWALALFEEIFVNVKDDPEIARRADTAAAAWRPQLDDLIATRKTDPGAEPGRAGGPDALGRLLAMQAAEPAAFTDEEIRKNFIGLITGFIPTIATATTFALDQILSRPDVLAHAQSAARSGDLDGVRAHMWEAMRLAPQGPGLFRRVARDYTIAEGTRHETTLREGMTVFAATQSAMLDGDVVDDPEDFVVGRPEHHYLHFGAGMHTCFGRHANAMVIPRIAMAVLSREDLQRAPGEAGRLHKDGPFPSSMHVTFSNAG
jgi:cytochrome P450